MLNLNTLYSEKSFEEVFRMFYAPLCGFAFKLIHNKVVAEDLVQEVLANVWKKEVPFDNIAVFRGYIYRAVRNKCSNYIRDNKVHEEYTVGMHDEEEDVNILNQMIKEEVYQQVMSFLDDLPEQRKRIYVMYLEGLKASEISESLDLSIETVRTQIKRAKKTLKEKCSKITYVIIMAVFFSV